uniref:C2H2-type domain-containing protein n=1 Tax=Cuerna arida TaxID=1464854 RepID=A0A1B6F6D8_9HEMI
MDFGQIEVCFICDGEVWNCKTVLSEEKTSSSKTPFPTKISQLIGEAFMVVVSENDKLCTRCTTLINRSDKLEMELKKMKHILVKLLFIKYNLNTIEEANFSLSQEPELSIEEADHEIFNDTETCTKGSSSEISKSPTSPNGNIKRMNLNFIKKKSNTVVNIKTEPLSCDTCEGTNIDIKPKMVIKCEDEPEKGIDDCRVSEKMKSSDIPFLCKDNPSESYQSHESSVFRVVKSEKHLSDNISNSKSICSQKLNSEKYSVKQMPLMKKSSVRTKPESEKLKTIPFKKLRQILPKITSFNDLATLCTVEINTQSNQTFGTPDSVAMISKVENADSYSSTESNCSRKIRTKDSGQKLKINENASTEQIINTSYTCKHCTRNFENNKLLQEHLNQHYAKNVFKCDFCYRSFRRKAFLNEHMKVHRTKESFICDFCGKEFKVRHILEEHRRSHTKEVPYVCDVCGKKFSFQSTYWLHRKWHDNPFPYKCDDCGRLFRHSSVLAVHRRKHSGERPYKCSYCSFTFTVSSALKRHLILHTKEYPFNCDICNRGFTARFRYMEHLSKVHNITIEKPVKTDFKMVVRDVFEDKTKENVVTRDITTEKIASEDLATENLAVNIVTDIGTELVIEETIVESLDYFDDQDNSTETFRGVDNETVVDDFYTQSSL